MSGYQPEHAAQARAAIAAVHQTYGTPGLDRENLVRDALPASVPADTPPGSLVLAAARAGIAGRLSASVSAGTDPADAVRTAAAALAATTALAVPACEWIVTEYAAVLGYAPAAAPGAPAAPQYRVGTAAPFAPPAYTQPADGTGQHGVAYAGAPGTQATGVRPRKPNRMPLVIVGVLVAFAVIGFTVIKLTSGDNSCTGKQCQQTLPPKPSGKHTVVPARTTPPPGGGGGTTTVALRYHMPRDITVSTCSTTSDYPTYLNGLTSYYTCDEDISSTLDGALVNGYQFGSPAAYAAGVVAFNAQIGFDPSAAGHGCPPAGDDGYSNWYRGHPDQTLGNVECYRNSSSNPVYVWTDDAEFTIIIVVADGQTFTDLDAWWKANNQNGLSAP